MQTTYSNRNLLFLLGFLFLSLSGFSQDDDFEVETYSKVRLGFYSHSGFYRQILLGFQNENATEGIDPGYDAVNTFNLPNDMYFYCNNAQLFIQGVGFFNDQNSYALGIKSSSEGTITIKLESTEYFSASQTFYIYDNQTQTYHNLKSGNFTTILGPGIFNERFSLRFLDQSVLGIDNQNLNTGVKVSYFSRSNELNIQNNLTGVVASEVTLFNINGQMLTKLNVENNDQKEMTLPLNHYNSGIYIVNVKTSLGTITKKIKIN